MPYPHKHLYLTIHWRPADYPLESGQVGVRFATTAPATQSLVNGLMATVQSLWTTASNKISSGYQLTFLRLASLDTTGLYAGGSSSFDGVYATPVSGGGGIDVNALQTACVTTLLTPIPHGQASKGRIYLPPINSSPAGVGDHYWSVTDCNARSAGVASALTSLSSIIGAPAAVMSKGTLRSTAGRAVPITGVATGRRPDVQRRRAKSQPDPRGSTSGVTISGGDPGAALTGWWDGSGLF